MANSVALASLSPQRRCLVNKMQWINHGFVEGLQFRDSDPLTDSISRVVTDVKLGSNDGPRPELNLDDFLLKTEVIKLFAYFDGLKSGTILRIEIQHGLPFRMQVEEFPGGDFAGGGVPSFPPTSPQSTSARKGEPAAV